jgi:hypothetical protein
VPAPERASSLPLHQGADRLSLIERVAIHLAERQIPFAVIGAAALAVHGVSRATRDLDLLTLAPECLDSATWEFLEADGVTVRVRRGDADDPLAGVVRFTAPGEGPVDLVVGKNPWQAAILSRVRRARVAGVDLPVARASDIVLLKLYAGGPQDAWDVEQLLGTGGRAALIAEVEAAIAMLPAESRELWNRITRRA